MREAPHRREQWSGCRFDVTLISTYHVGMRSNASRLAASPATVHQDCYCLNAQRAARRLARLYDDGLRPFELNHGQFSLLMLVAGLQPVSVGQVAAELVMDRTTVTAAVKPLERRGLLSTAASSTDQRQRLLSLTSSGLALLSRASAQWRKLQQTVQDHPPRATVRADLRRLAATAADPSTRATARRT
jgi:DNA-binding MarR family transcriptional regulator